MSRFRVVAVVGVVLLALLSGAGGPAVAGQVGVQTQPTDPRLHCDSGASEMICWFSWTGGTAPFTIRWYINGNLREKFNDSSGARFFCQSGRSVRVYVKLTDVHGHWLEVEGLWYCNGGPWP